MEHKTPGPSLRNTPSYRRKRTNTIPFDKYVEGELKRFLAADSQLPRQAKLLSAYVACRHSISVGSLRSQIRIVSVCNLSFGFISLEVYLRADYFIFTSKAEELAGKNYLLQLWISLLNSLDAGIARAACGPSSVHSLVTHTCGFLLQCLYPRRLNGLNASSSS